jgi:cobalt-zinc-cadmium efflux system membrane fusion protein
MLGELGVDEQRYAEVGSPVGARIVRIVAAVGDRVEAGAVLAEVHSAELGKARAEYVSAGADVDLTRRTLERKRRLVEQRIAAAKDVLEAEAAAKAAEARVEAARAVLRSLGVPDAEKPGAATFLLRSPIAGTVIDRRTVLGKFVEPSETLFRIADLATLWLTVRAFERDAVRVRTGVPASIRFAALPARTFSGTIMLVGQHVDPGSRTVAVRIDVPNEDGVLRPGMSATALVPVGERMEDIVAVPAVALQRIGDAWTAFVPKDEGVFEMRRVGRGRELGNEVEIVSGLRAGENVVVAGSFLLKAEAERARGEVEHHAH